MAIFKKEELEKIKGELENAKKRLVEITSQKGEAAEIGGNVWHDNFTFEELVRKENEIMNQIAKLKDIIGDAEVIREVNDKVVGVGSFVLLQICNKKAEWFEVVGYGQSDPENKRISHNSPIGSSVLGKNVGGKGEFVVKGKRIQVIVLDIKSEKDS